MRSAKPPAIATWMVEHLIPGGKNEALVGDLLEQFTYGRSAAWYWQQALIAILVGISKQLCILWVAVGVTTLSTYAILQFRSVMTMFYDFMRPGITLAWPASLVYTVGCLAMLNALPLMVALCAYQGLTKSLSLRRFSRGLLVGLGTVALGMVLGWALLPTWRHPNFMGYIVASLPLFFALLLSMWTAKPHNSGNASSKIIA